MNAQSVQDIGALLMVAVAVGVVAFLAANGNETATGALISVISAGTAFYLRGRVQTSVGNVTTGTGSGEHAVTATANRETASVTVSPPVAKPEEKP